MTHLKDDANRSSHEEIAATLEAFVSTSNWNEAFDLLEEKEVVLLSDRALGLLQSVITRGRANGDSTEELEVYLRLLEDSRMDGLMAARRSFESRLRETSKTLTSLINAENSGDPNNLRKLLDDERSVLQSTMAVVVLRAMTKEAYMEGDTLLAEGFKEYVQLLEDVRRVGITTALRNFEQQREQQAQNDIEVLTQFTSVSSWEEAYHLLKERQDILLSEIAVAYLQIELTELHARGNTLASQRLEHLLRLLENARTSGIDTAWESFNKMLNQPKLPEDLSLIMGEIPRLTQPQELPRKVELLSQALSVVEQEGDIHFWALLHGLRGVSYIDIQRLLGGNTESLDRAIADFDAALTYFSREAFPNQWADTLRTRGIAYTMHIQGNRAMNFEQAISDYNAALTVFTAETESLDWAKTLLRRGDAYAERIAGDHGQNQEQAISDYSAALTVLTREISPHDWAKTLRKRGAIYCERISGAHAQNIEQAISDYGAALDVFTRESFPDEWAGTHMNRGIAYRLRIRGDWAENIEQAIRDLDAALEVFTREAYPRDWAVAHMNRGIIYSARIRGDYAQKIEQAISDYGAALEIFKPETHTYEWSVTHTNRGSAYIHRIFGKADENQEQAISDFDAALEVLRHEVFPVSWANGHMRRGIAYLKRIRGDWAENIEQAIRDLDAALEVFTREAYPRDWARTHHNRAGAYKNRLQGNRAENLQQAIAGYTAALQVYTREAFPIDWAHAHSARGSAYADRIRGSESENLESALADYNAALEVITREALPRDWAAALVNRAGVYRKLAGRNDAETLEQLLSDYNSALEIFTRDTEPIAWACACHDRGVAYLERILGNRSENIECAIADFNAALEVFARDTSPMLWARAHLSRGDAFKVRVLGDRTTNLEQALNDTYAALKVFTPEALPREYRDAQLKRAQILESLRRWQEAHMAFVAASETIDLLMETASTSIGRAEVLGERTEVDLYLLDAQVLLKCEPPDLAAATCALEAGRARILRRVLDLDTLTSAHIKKASARKRMAAFLAARNSWQEAQRLLPSPLPVDLNRSQREAEIRFRHQRLEVAYAAFIQARDVIRQHDNPDFLISKVTLEEIARAVPLQDAALVYLVAGEESGIVLVVTCDSAGTLGVQYIPLPRFTEKAIGNLFLTRALRPFQTEDEAGRRELTVGGLSTAQMDAAFELLQSWGGSLGEVITTLPHDCSFYSAAQLLINVLTANPVQRKLLDQPFTAYSKAQYSRIARAFNRAVLNLELERSLRKLGELGLSELAQFLYKQGVHKITLIPYRYLNLFPLSAVQVSLFDGSKQHLGGIFEVTISPSARAAQVAYERASGLDRLTRPFVLTVGDPQPLPTGVPSLPYAQSEAEATAHIAKTFNYAPNTIRYLRPREATKLQVVKALEQAWYAQLAMHGTYRIDEPRLSCLVLAGNESVPEAERGIYLDEALNGTVNLIGLRLLVLSACETARIDTALTNEVLGLAAGFQQAGAAGVIASLWAVDDQATYLLMSRFAQLYLDPQRNWSPARALAEAQRWLREEASNRVIATYDPIETEAFIPTPPVAEGRPNAKEALSEAKNEFMISTARSLRYSHSSALIEMHTQAARRAEIAPDTLPYADPVYWAAFTVTGC